MYGQIFHGFVGFSRGHELAFHAQFYTSHELNFYTISLAITRTFPISLSSIGISCQYAMPIVSDTLIRSKIPLRIQIRRVKAQRKHLAYVLSGDLCSWSFDHSSITGRRRSAMLLQQRMGGFRWVIPLIPRYIRAVCISDTCSGSLCYAISSILIQNSNAGYGSRETSFRTRRICWTIEGLVFASEMFRSFIGSMFFTNQLGFSIYIGFSFQCLSWHASILRSECIFREPGAFFNVHIKLRRHIKFHQLSCNIGFFFNKRIRWLVIRCPGCSWAPGHPRALLHN